MNSVGACPVHECTYEGFVSGKEYCANPLRESIRLLQL